jgi:hypothetical protein
MGAGRGPGGEGHLPQGVHDARRIAPVRATLGARLAGQAQPDRGVREHAIGAVEVDQPHHVVRAQRRLGGHRAARGALAALVATGRLDAGPAAQRLGQRRRPVVGPGVRISHLPSRAPYDPGAFPQGVCFLSQDPRGLKGTRTRQGLRRRPRAAPDQGTGTEGVDTGIRLAYKVRPPPRSGVAL